ncbi:hypothetical protein SAMD00024442_20_22 [Candidatus Symbiothrix dinenymphae]|nr:hypothetical protein SAMD00024442_20_22 [Candidatus Symbiothrix dinenymphae]
MSFQKHSLPLPLSCRSGNSQKKILLNIFKIKIYERKMQLQEVCKLCKHYATTWRSLGGGGARSLRASRRKVSLFLSGIFVSVLFALSYGCKEETYEFTQSQVGGDPHNPALPVTVTGFTPDSGRIREKVLIYGSNFGTDASQVEVLFNDGVADRKANVISASGTTIYCLAPKQSSGSNQIKVSVAGGSAATASKTFGYTARETVSWFAGAGNSNGNYGQNDARGALDGPLATATFFKPQGIVALGGGQVMTFGFHQGIAARTRFISEPDNQVITLQQNAYMGKPAVNEERTIVYNTFLNPPYTVYQYSKTSGWAPQGIGEIKMTTPETVPYDKIRTLVMQDKAHDPNQEWLYFCHREKIFARYNVNTDVTEEISTSIAGLPTSGWAPYMVYDRFKDCFYASYFQSYSIYKITKTGANWGDGVEAVRYAGDPLSSHVIDGALADARFFQPMGMCMDDEGNLYICEQNSTDGGVNNVANEGDVIRKISGIDGYVSTVAGMLGVEGPPPRVKGEPLKSVLLDPSDISYDGEGNFYIAEWWESQICKYSVE